MGFFCCCHKRRSKNVQMLRKELICNSPIYSPNVSSRDLTKKARLAACRLSQFRYRKQVGSGRYGTVYCVVDRRSGNELAMKVVSRNHEIYSLEPRLEKEHIVLFQLKSVWLLEMIQCFETPTKLYMLLEYLPGPSLVNIAKKRYVCLHLKKTYMAEMMMALQAVHHYGYMHRDIKLTNFLLDNFGHVKLCDFGTCIRFMPEDSAKRVFPLYDRLYEMPSEETLQSRRSLFREEEEFQPLIPHGTSYYCAPEVIRLATRKPTLVPYTYLCDYWSLGVCFYYLLYGKLPFYDDEKVRIPSLILNWSRTLKFPRKVDPAGVALVRALLQDEATRLGRNGIVDITTHDFFRDFDWLVIRHMNAHYWSITKDERHCDDYDNQRRPSYLLTPVSSLSSTNNLVSPNSPPSPTNQRTPTKSRTSKTLHTPSNQRTPTNQPTTTNLLTPTTNLLTPTTQYTDTFI